MVGCSWDSGPFSTFWESDRKTHKIEGPGGYGENVVPIPRVVWDRYCAAREELDEAESALGDAEQAYLDEARPADPRWANRG